MNQLSLSGRRAAAGAPVCAAAAAAPNRIEARVSLINEDSLGLIVGWNVEVDQFAAESAGLPGPERDPDGHPDASGDLRGAAEIEPEEKTDQEAEARLESGW